MDKNLKQYHLVNNVIGWMIGIIACAVYIMTAEATASWWDCGEYIATAFKVQVGHPPGAPTFQIIGRLFSLFTDPYHAAFAVNVMSAVASGLGIMFLYWTITLLGKKLLKAEELTLNNMKVWAVFASGIVGALPTPSPTPTGSRLSRVRSMQCPLSSPLWCSGQSLNGRSRVTTLIRSAGSY